MVHAACVLGCCHGQQIVALKVSWSRTAMSCRFAVILTLQLNLWRTGLPNVIGLINLPAKSLLEVTQDTHQQLCEIIVSQGSETYFMFFFHQTKFMSNRRVRFLSDPDLGGTEKVTIADPIPGVAPKHLLRLEDLELGDEVADTMSAPHSYILVKGWTRMFCAYTVMLCSQQVPEFLQASRRFSKQSKFDVIITDWLLQALDESVIETLGCK